MSLDTFGHRPQEAAPPCRLARIICGGSAGERFAFACLWADLARLAGEPLPRDVAAVVDSPLGVVPVAVPSFGQRNDLPVYAD